MRRFILFAVLAIIAVAMVGCGVKELTDDTYADIICETYTMEDEAEMAGVLEGYNTTFEEFRAYGAELFQDEARLTAVTEAISEKNPFAGIAFGLQAAFGNYKELNDDTYADIFCETYTMEDEAEVAGILEGYNSTLERFEAYTMELFQDEARLTAVTEAITEKDSFAGTAFGMVAAFGSIDD